MKKLLLVALSTFAVSAHAWEPAYYAGSSVTSWKFKAHSFNKNFHLQTLEVNGGVLLSPYVSVEVRGGAGLSPAKENIYSIARDDAGVPMKDAEGNTLYNVEKYQVDLSYYVSGYFRPYIANEKATLYGLLGVTTLELDGAADVETDISYGVGVSFVTSPRTQFTAEWKKLINAEEFDVRGGSLGFIYKF